MGFKVSVSVQSFRVLRFTSIRQKIEFSGRFVSSDSYSKTVGIRGKKLGIRVYW